MRSHRGRDQLTERRRRHRARGVPRPAGAPGRQAGRPGGSSSTPCWRRSIEACDYLLAVDIDMTPLPGYRFANWEQGYGDISARARPRRRCAWCRGSTRRRWSCATWSTCTTGEPIDVSPRAILRRQVDAGRRARLHGEDRRARSSSSCSRTPTPRPPPRATATSRRTRTVIEDYHILQTTSDEYVIRADPQRHARRGRAGGVLQGRGRAGPARDQPRLRRARSRWPIATPSTRTGPRRSPTCNGRSLTFMAKYDMDEVGSSCHIHSSLWDQHGRDVADVGRRRRPHDMSEVFRHWLGGLVHASRELSLLFAPDVNSYKRFQPDSWAPTAVAWGLDNRTCGLPPRRPRPGLPGGVPHPRRRRQLLPRVRRRPSPPGCTASPTSSIPATPFVGNAYADPDIAAHPVAPSSRPSSCSSTARWPARRSATTCTTTC